MNPDAKMNRRRIGSVPFFLGFSGLSMICIVVICLTTSNYFDSHRFSPKSTLFVLGVEPSIIKLGNLVPGQDSSRVVLVRNRTSAPVTIDRLETSCPCISAKATPSRVESGGLALVTVKYDSAEDPEFTGTLAVECSGLSSSGELLFRFRVDLTVLNTSNMLGFGVSN
jgi:hypothetical protein